MDYFDPESISKRLESKPDLGDTINDYTPEISENGDVLMVGCTRISFNQVKLIYKAMKHTKKTS